MCFDFFVKNAYFQYTKAFLTISFQYLLDIVMLLLESIVAKLYSRVTEYLQDMLYILVPYRRNYNPDKVL